jgi:hypothetical protein
MKTLIDFRTKPKEQRADLIIRDDDFVATVDVLKQENAFTFDWWISGTTRDDQLRLLMRFQVSVPDLNTSFDALEVAESFWETSLREMAWGSANGGGLPDLPSPPSVETRREHVKIHLKEHNEVGNLDKGDSRAYTRTLREYQLVKSFGYKSAQPLIAEFEDVPLSTIVRRLSMARDAGLLPKQNSKD